MLVSNFDRSEIGPAGIRAKGCLAHPKVRVCVLFTVWHRSLVLLFASLLGCEGRPTTDTLLWSCNESCEACPLVSQPSSLAGFWRFDGAELGGQWISVDGTGLKWIPCSDNRGGDWVSEDARPKVCGTERLGGTGGSLRLSGDGRLEAALPGSLPARPLTLAAWVSLLRGTVAPMTVLSVVRPACQSVWLGLRAADGQRSMVLSMEKSVEGGDVCAVEQWTASLPSGFFDWGLGSFYHLAATVDVDGTPALFVDGRPLSSAFSGGESLSVGPVANVLIIGADPLGEQPFKGLIDDVAVFSEPLTSDQLRDFIAPTVGVRSDGQLWIPWSVDGSSTSWESDCAAPAPERSTGGAAVVVRNGYWSAGGLLAHLDSQKRIGSLKKATLVADVPSGESFDFVLSSSHNAERCTWNTTGAGQGRYEFTLDTLNSCDCPSTCDCRFEVAEARVGARWDQDGSFRFSTCRVELEWEASTDDSELDLKKGPGGTAGLNGWCWRPVTFHPGAYVDLDEGRTNEQMTVGTLLGGNRVTAYLAADFALDGRVDAHSLCDLSQVTEITVEASMPAGFSYQLRLADYTGIAREWSRKWKDDQPNQTFTLCPSEGSEDECGRDVDPIPAAHRPVDLGRIRYLGIQKTFELSSDAGEIAIKRVTFTGPVAGHCEIVDGPWIEDPQ